MLGFGVLGATEDGDGCGVLGAAGDGDATAVDKVPANGVDAVC